MLNGFQKGRKDMTEKTFKFKIVPQQERFYNENSNWGVYTFTTTSDDIPYFYDCYDDPFGAIPSVYHVSNEDMKNALEKADEELQEFKKEFENHWKENGNA